VHFASYSRVLGLWLLEACPVTESNKPWAHALILKLLSDCCEADTQGRRLVPGSPDFTLRYRAWQALCIAVRFVDAKIVEDVIDATCRCLADRSPQLLRHYMEGE
jgi:hypothetical protein